MGKLRNYFLNHYPRTDFHELNQDWMISMLYDMINQVENFVEMNSVKYANPIQWDITRQYEKNTIVVDPVTGTAYISSKAVPMGVALSRTEYWNVIFDLGRFITLASQNFANSYEAVLTTTATMETDKDAWVVWNSLLYKALNDIHIGDRYVEDGNIERYTVEMFFDELAHLISEETEARIEADTALHGEIVDESVARENADNALEGDIDAEATAREDADTALQGNIDAEATAREDADDVLQNNIDAEETARENADTRLEGLINDEATARINADNALNTRIDNVSDNRFKSIKDYGYTSGSNITQYVQAFIDDDDASELYLYEDGIFTINQLNMSGVENATDKVKRFNKSANTIITGEGGIQLGIATMTTEIAEINSSYSTGGAGSPWRVVRNSDESHPVTGEVQSNAMFIDNINNADDGYYHWNLLAQSNIRANTSGQNCAAYFQTHVYEDNENWALATENILHISEETRSTRGIEISLTGNSGVSSRGGKRIGIHLANNTTGSGFNSDYAIYVTSHAASTGFRRILQIETGYSEIGICFTGMYTCVYGIDFKDCNINGAAIRLGKNGGHAIQFDSVTMLEENQLGVDVLAIKRGNNNLGLLLTESSNVTGIVKYIDVIYNGQGYKIPLYQ